MIEDYLRKTFSCECGKVHKVDIENVVVRSGALESIPKVIAGLGAKRVLLIADENTYEAAGSRVESTLRGADISHGKLVFHRQGDLVPDERALGEIFASIDDNTDALLAVGSGTINDLAKYVSYKMGIPMAIVATAPSMDGYASDSSALILEELKTSCPVVPPKAIIADTDIIKDAPMAMILAGLGDMLGKYNALKDWKLANLILGEYYCPKVAQMVEKSLDTIMASIEGIRQRDEAALESLMEGLVLTGIAMSFVGNSRPASGAEHHLSHFWEMMFLLQGKPAVLHGTKVGITTLATTEISRSLAEKVPNFKEILGKPSRFDDAQWSAQIRRVYGRSAPGILKLNREGNRNSLEEKKMRKTFVMDHWGEIVAILRQGPSAHEIKAILESVNAPTHPRDIGVDEKTVFEGMLYAKEIRSRYTVLQLLWDIDLLETYAHHIRDYYFGNQTPKSLLRKIKTFVLDLDGTFYIEDQIFEGSLDFLKVLDKRGIEFKFFTNNSSKDADYYIDRIAKMGYSVPPDTMMTSTHVIIDYIKEHMPGKRVFVLGTKYLVGDLTKAGIDVVEDEPDIVVVGFDTTLRYDRLAKACDFIRGGCTFLAVHPDLNCPVKTGFIPDCGSICALITASTGIHPMYFGKPTAFTLDYIKKRTGVSEGQIAFVGDRLYTDIALGEGTDLITILVLTGETKEKDLETSHIKPRLVFESLKDIGDLLEEID